MLGQDKVRSGRRLGPFTGRRLTVVIVAISGAIVLTSSGGDGRSWRSLHQFDSHASGHGDELGLGRWRKGCFRRSDRQRQCRPLRRDRIRERHSRNRSRGHRNAIRRVLERFTRCRNREVVGLYGLRGAQRPVKHRRQPGNSSISNPPSSSDRGTARRWPRSQCPLDSCALQGSASAYATSVPVVFRVYFSASGGAPTPAYGLLLNQVNVHETLASEGVFCASVSAGTYSYKSGTVSEGGGVGASDGNDLASIAVQVFSQ